MIIQLNGFSTSDNPNNNPTAPEQFRILRWGINASTKGDVILTRKLAEQMIETHRARNIKLSIDYGHAIMTTEQTPNTVKAAGWFDLELRSDGLWAVNVEWTDAAKISLENKEYRYFSPLLEMNSSREVIRLINVALVLAPALDDIEPLAASDTIPAAMIPEDDDGFSTSDNPNGLSTDGLSNNNPSDNPRVASEETSPDTNRDPIIGSEELSEATLAVSDNTTVDIVEEVKLDVLDELPDLTLAEQMLVQLYELLVVETFEEALAKINVLMNASIELETVTQDMSALKISHDALQKSVTINDIVSTKVVPFNALEYMSSLNIDALSMYKQTLSDKSPPKCTKFKQDVDVDVILSQEAELICKTYKLDRELFARKLREQDK
jgi:hypothetical protein